MQDRELFAQPTLPLSPEISLHEKDLLFSEVELSQMRNVVPV